jgi:hypothetical protein
MEMNANSSEMDDNYAVMAQNEAIDEWMSWIMGLNEEFCWDDSTDSQISIFRELFEKNCYSLQSLMRSIECLKCDN